MSVGPLSKRAANNKDPELENGKARLSPVQFPVENYSERANYNRFHGYHVGEDLEAQEPTFENMPGSYATVQSIAEGVVTYADWVAGYGGVMVVNHAALSVSAVYGHLNPEAFRANVGDRVEKGQVLGFLGVEGPQTDNERSHLHFALYKGEDVRLKGYVASPEELEEYVNPRTLALRNRLSGRGGHYPLFRGRRESRFGPEGLRRHFELHGGGGLTRGAEKLKKTLKKPI